MEITEFCLLAKCAEILCQRSAHYAFECPTCPEELHVQDPDWHDNYDKTHVHKEGNDFCFDVNPFRIDMIEYVNQANAIEDWLMINHYLLWQKSNESMIDYPIKPYSEHGAFWQQNRLLRMRWCIEQIIKQDLTL